jgi:hypothetical protein
MVPVAVRRVKRPVRHGATGREASKCGGGDEAAVARGVVSKLVK